MISIAANNSTIDQLKKEKHKVWIKLLFKILQEMFVSDLQNS